MPLAARGCVVKMLFPSFFPLADFLDFVLVSLSVLEEEQLRIKDCGIALLPIRVEFRIFKTERGNSFNFLQM